MVDSQIPGSPFYRKPLGPDVELVPERIIERYKEVAAQHKATVLLPQTRFGPSDAQLEKWYNILNEFVGNEVGSRELETLRDEIYGYLP